MADHARFRERLREASSAIADMDPRRVHRSIHDCFVIAAYAGDVARAAQIVRLLYDPRLPPWRRDLSVWVPGTMDVFCWVNDLGDLTGGEPWRESEWWSMPTEKDDDLDTRAIAWLDVALGRLTTDHGGEPASTDWRRLEGGDLWRAVQALARPGDEERFASTERTALEAITRLLDHEGAIDELRGDDVLLGLDLALRHGANDRVMRWIERYADRVLDGPIDQALCLLYVAEVVAQGWFRPALGVSAEDLEAAVNEIASGLEHSLRRSAEPAPLIQKRWVECPYSQFAIEPYEHEGPHEKAYFQDDGESEQGMSLFEDRVGVATPSETEGCFVEVSLADAPPSDAVETAVQAVSFPLHVRGELGINDVCGDGENPVRLPEGRYDVLACFDPMEPSPGDHGLRRFCVRLYFCPSGSLGAPRCLKLLEGELPNRIVRQ